MTVRQLEETNMAATERQETAEIATREVAKRVFAAELNNSTYTFRTSKADEAPVYALLPTGEKANRVLIAGTVTEVGNVGDEEEYLRARIVDPTGTFFVYAGFYQPEAMEALRDIQPPEFVILVGKPRTYKTESGRINVSIVPESVNVIDREARDRWVFETAAYTLDRYAASRDDPSQIATMAREQYGGDGEVFGDVAAFALQDLAGGTLELPDKAGEDNDSAPGQESDTDSDAIGDDVDNAEETDSDGEEEEEAVDDLDAQLNALEDDVAANKSEGQDVRGKTPEELGRDLANPSSTAEEAEDPASE